jgi:integrase
MAPRIKNDGRPKRVYFKHGQHWFVDKSNKWHPLGKTEAQMYRGLAKLSIEAPPEDTMNAVIRRYIDEVVPAKAEANQKTNIRYLEEWALYLGNMNPRKVRPHHIAKFHDEKGKKAPVSANRSLEVIRHVFTKAKRWGHVDDNPAKALGRHPETPRDRVVSVDEYLAVYMMASPAYQVAMELERLTGMRQADILKLKWSEVTREGIFNQAGKNKRKLLFKMNHSLEITLNDARGILGDAISHYVVPSRKGGRFTSSGFQSGWQRLMRKAAKEGVARFTFHDIRSVAADLKEDDKSAAELLGNTLTTTRKHYRRKHVMVEPNR